MAPAQVVMMWPVDPVAGIATLSMVYAPDIKVGAARVATTARELQEAWEFFGFREPPPQIRFDERVVLLFVEGDVCDDRGRGRAGQPPLGAWLFDDGAIVPLFPDPGQISCPESSRRLRTGFAYAVSAPRIPAVRTLRVTVGFHPRVAATPRSSQSPLSPVSSSRLSGEEALLHKRADGTPVWVVRHLDASLSALGADYEPFPEWLPGFRYPVSFSPAQARFNAPFDEWGTHLSGAREGLERFELRLRDGEPEVGASLGRVPAGRPRGFDATRAPGAASSSTRPFADTPRRSVRDALQQAPSSWSVVTGHALLGGPSVELCDGKLATDCARIVDLHPGASCRGRLDGDFAVQSVAGAFSHLVALGSAHDYACATEGGMRPWWVGGGENSWGMEPVTLAASVGAYGGVTGGAARFGGEAALHVRFRRERSYPEPFLQAQLGDVFELGLRAHWFDSPARDARPGWAAGIAPTLSGRPAFSAWSTPTLFGVLLPEMGLRAQSDSYRAYLAWRFAVEYRKSPLRQRPYTADERLAWQVTPQFLWTLGDTSERWQAGISAGLVLW